MSTQNNGAAAALPLRRVVMQPSAGLALLTVVGMSVYAGSLIELGFTKWALLTVGSVGIAALLSGIAGFAFSAICGAILFQFRHDTVSVVQIMMICSIANQALSVWLLRGEIRIADVAPFIAGGVAGVPAGVWLLLHLDNGAYVKGLGAILLLYGCYMLVRPAIVLRRPPAAGDVVSGFVAGVVGGFAASPGTIVSIWCGMKGWDKGRQRAVFQPFILVMQIVSLVAIAIMHGSATPNVDIPPIVWACVPIGLVGTFWGLACFRRMSDRQFAIAINVLLMVSGAGLIL